MVVVAFIYECNCVLRINVELRFFFGSWPYLVQFGRVTGPNRIINATPQQTVTKSCSIKKQHRRRLAVVSIGLTQFDSVLVVKNVCERRGKINHHPNRIEPSATYSIFGTFYQHRPPLFLSPSLSLFLLYFSLSLSLLLIPQTR